MELTQTWERLRPDDPPTLVWTRPPSGHRARVVFLLGAFDPPTNAHLAMVDAACRATGAPAAFCLTKPLLARPDDWLLPPPERLRLLDALAEEHGLGLAICNRGTYLGVARAAAAEGTEAVFVVGSDKLPKLEDPSFYPDGRSGVEATFEEASFLVVPRDGGSVDRRGVRVLNPSEVFADPQQAGISATEVRARLRRGEDASAFVPPVVALAVEGYTDRTEPG